MKKNLYYYKAKVTSVYDGDTCTVDIDLGLHVVIKGEKLRLQRINAPEVRGASKEEGKKSRDFLRTQILNKEIYLETIKDKKGKYGRYLAEIWVEGAGEKLININDLLVSKCFAVYKQY